MQDVIKINQEDNVAVALRPIAKGETLDIAGTPVTTLEEIPQGHKVAVKPIAQGGNVIKYGFRIGVAKEDIKVGQWVHVHNIKTALGDLLTYEYEPTNPSVTETEHAYFDGFRRTDGKVGVKDIPWIYNLKLRASWGQLGNERIDLFRYVDLMNLKVIKNDGSITDYNYPLNGAMQSGAAITAYNDPNITWETTTMTNVGIDASLLNGNLDFSFEFFDKRTSDILRKVTLPDQVGGLDGPIRNIGEVSNKGFELNMGYRNNIGDFRYEVNGNMTFIKNKIVSLKGQTIIDGMFILEEGKPIDSYYMLHAIGIFQSEEEIKNSPYQTAATKPGYLKFEDTNGDGKITEDDRQIRGGVIPKITYGFNINLGYKDWDLSAFFQGVTDVYTYGDRIGATPLWFGCGLPEQWLTDAWTPERGTSATLPILTTYEGCLNENFRTNDFWLRNASYLRLKNLQLSYNVPASFLKSGVVKRLKVFVNAQNLFTFSPMKDFDPEKNLKGSNWYAYPSVRTYTAGVNVTF